MKKIVIILNELTSLFAELPGAVTDGIPLSFTGMILIFLVLIFLIRWLEQKSFNDFRLALILLSVFCSDRLIRVAKLTCEQEMVIFSGTKKFSALIRSGLNSWILCSEVDSARVMKNSYDYLVFKGLPVNSSSNCMVERHDASQFPFLIKNGYLLSGNFCVLFACKGKANFKIKPDIVFIDNKCRNLFNGENKINSRLITMYRPAGSYKTDHTGMHILMEQGALTINLQDYFQRRAD